MMECKCRFNVHSKTSLIRNKKCSTTRTRCYNKALGLLLRDCDLATTAQHPTRATIMGASSLPSAPFFGELYVVGRKIPDYVPLNVTPRIGLPCRDPVYSYHHYPGGPMRKASRKGTETNNWSDDLQDHRINCLKRGNRVAAVCQPWCEKKFPQLFLAYCR